MGLIIQKRVKLGGGVGLNVSKTGVSVSKRAKWGTIGTKGYSIRTGVPGVYFRKRFSKSDSGIKKFGISFFVILWIVISSIFSLIFKFIYLVFYNLFKFIGFVTSETYLWIKEERRERQVEGRLKKLDPTYLQTFDLEKIGRKYKFHIDEVHVRPRRWVEVGKPIYSLASVNKKDKYTITAEAEGEFYPLFRKGEAIEAGEELYAIYNPEAATTPPEKPLPMLEAPTDALDIELKLLSETSYDLFNQEGSDAAPVFQLNLKNKSNQAVSIDNPQLMIYTDPTRLDQAAVYESSKLRKKYPLQLAPQKSISIKYNPQKLMEILATSTGEKVSVVIPSEGHHFATDRLDGDQLESNIQKVNLGRKWKVPNIFEFDSKIV